MMIMQGADAFFQLFYAAGIYADMFKIDVCFLKIREDDRAYHVHEEYALNHCTLTPSHPG